jgi:hypothetical protein
MYAILYIFWNFENLTSGYLTVNEKVNTWNFQNTKKKRSFKMQPLLSNKPLKNKK